MMRIIGMPGVIRVDHIGIAVFDLDAGVDWYQRFLGASLIGREINLEQMVEEATLDLKGTTFQLIKPIGELSPVNKFLETRGEGLQQIALEVSNLDNSVDFALENHIRVIFEKSKNGTNGSRINFLHPKDCFGVLIELVEHPKVQLKLKQSE
jgi:methylmalonyl-CoA/ethylmalonyl-CoA epimerase